MRRYENLIDAAFAAGGDLTVALVKARQARGLSAIVAQPFFESISRAQVELIEARSLTVAGHRHLDKIAPLVGIDATMFGDAGKPPASM